MDRAEMVALIRNGVPNATATWADLGAGTGNFTWALSQLLRSGSSIWAIDRDLRAVQYQQTHLAAEVSGVAIRPMQADFTQRLKLPPLDGILMANALHFIRDQAALLEWVQHYLRPDGRLLIVEYEVDRPLRWVPFPVPFRHFAALADASGLGPPRLIGSRRSPSTDIVMYAAVALGRD